jgi:hypothetical protein
LQSKWDKAFWAGGYYVSIIGRITEQAIKKYIREQAAIIALLRAHTKLPVKLVVGDFFLSFFHMKC